MQRRRSGLGPLFAIATLSAAASAHAQQAAPGPAQAPDPRVRNLAATCAACHGTDGRAVAGTSMVSLAGLPAEHLVAQMKAFRDGRRPATVMHQIAKGYSDAQIDALALHFAAVR